MKEKKSLLDIISGGKELPVKTEVVLDKTTQEVIVGSILALSLGAIAVALIVKRR